MLKWIGKVLGGSSSVAADGVPEAWAKKLKKTLQRIDKIEGIRRDLSDDIAAYVLRAESSWVLAEIAKDERIGECLHLLGYHYGDSAGELTGLYADFDAVPPATALRWARVLEACIAAKPSSLRFQFPNNRQWPELLLLASAGHSLNGWSSQRPKAHHLSAQIMETMLAEDGQDPAALLVSAFATPTTSGYGVEQRLQMVTDLVGYPDMLDRHIESIRPLMHPLPVAQRLHVLNMLTSASATTLEQLADELCEHATANSKQVRIAAEALLRRGSPAARQPLRRLAVEGKPEQRVHALRLIALLANAEKDDALLAFAQATALADKAASVQALILEWKSEDIAATPEEMQSYTYAVPVIDWSGVTNQVAPDVLKALWRDVNESVAKANKQSRDHYERMLAAGHNYKLHQDPLLDDSDLKRMQSYLASDQTKPPSRSTTWNHSWRHVAPAILRIAGTETITAVALFKLLKYFDLAEDNQGALPHQSAQSFNAMFRRQGRPSLLELSQIITEAGGNGAELLRNYCHWWGQTLAADWPNEAVWPFFAHHVDFIARVLTQSLIKDYSFNRSGLFRGVATLPTPPNTLINALFNLALGSGKTDRLEAQDALQNLPGKEARIINALADGKSETRAIAAGWLGRLRHAEAVPFLEQALAKEKMDLAKGAMLDALQALDQPVEKYLNRTVLAAEASKAMTKAVPKDLEWFPWNALPEVRWHDSGGEVTRDILRWLLLQAFKQKSPEPNTVLRKYCAMFEPRDRERLGQFVLESWLTEDVRPIDPDDALARARSHAQSMHQWMSSSPQYFQNSPHLGKSVEEITASVLPGFLRQPRGSAIASKGLLAVVAACAAERAALPVQRYIKEWYGSRAGQGKALIAMLAWIEHPSATQLMLAIGSRFRTKSFQEEATRQAEALAERKGWTLAELADRTVPSAGFDESGELALSYGERQFTARLLPDFSVELFNPDGKKISALPEPRQDDDADVAKESKKAFSAAKKDLKSIVALQTDRLYEALCTEREWSFADWKAYLLQHPVLRHLVQRLVWVEVSEGKPVQSFRPLDDGTLTDRDDNEIVISETARIRLAHDSLLDADDVSAWQQHLQDYEIKPLFQQLGKGSYTLPSTQAKLDEIKDFEGHLLEAFALRGRALKLGYTRGAAEDGGWFHVYEKRFPTLGLEAVIEFTGNPLPEENRTVALLNLSFTASGGEAWQRGKLPLARVPKILLSECYNDLRLIAAEGSGFDPQWEKKSEY